MINSDGTRAKDRLTGFVPVTFSNGQAAVQFTVTDGDAKVISEASAEELSAFGPYIWAQLVHQIKEEVAKTRPPGPLVQFTVADGDPYPFPYRFETPVAGPIKITVTDLDGLDHEPDVVQTINGEGHVIFVDCELPVTWPGPLTVRLDLRKEEGHGEARQG